MIAFWIVIGAIVVLFCALSVIFASIIVHGHRQSMDESWQWQQDNVEACRNFTRDMFTEYIVKGPKGEDIHTVYLPAKEPSDYYVILAHGYTDTRWGMMKYVPKYYKLGFNCIMFDERGHGMSAKEVCSYSIKEIDFLIAVIEDTFKRYGDNIKLGLHGESLGGAIVLRSLGCDIVKNRISFVVDDCGFAEIIPVLKIGMKNTHVPQFMVYPASVAAKLIYGNSFTAARPIDYVKGNKVPLMCMHGEDDDFILPEHSKKVYETTEGIKDIHIFKGATHAISSVVAPDEYYEHLKAFFEKVFGHSFP